jgi:hypothetical protein
MPLPDIKHALICEDIRLERRNLSSFMGVYGYTPYVGIKIANFQKPVGFCALFAGTPGQGKYIIEAELRNPDGSQIEAEVMPKGFEFVFSPEMGGSAIGFRFRATFAGPETYTLALVNGGKVFHSETFRLLHGQQADFL